MSSNLKDARWQLASEMAAHDGLNFWASGFEFREVYLNIARQRLQGQPQEFIDRLAAKFREED